MRKIISFISILAILFNTFSFAIAEDGIIEENTELSIENTEEENLLDTIFGELGIQDQTSEQEIIIEEKQNNVSGTTSTLEKNSDNLAITVPINLDNKLKLTDVAKLKEDKFRYLETSNKEYTEAEALNTDLPYVEGDLIIKYKEGKEPKITAKVASLENRGILSEKEDIAKNIAVIKSEKKTTQELINEFQNDPNVEYVQPNFIYYTQSISLPNDTDFGKLRGLHNTGQSINSATGVSIGIADVDIDWPEAMSIFSGSTQGTGSIVAVIDSGINYLHDDLKNRIWDGTNCVSETGAYLGNCKGGYDFYYNDKDPIDTSGGHGTHLAGIIAAEMNNSLGVTGVNPNAKIMVIKGSNDLGNSLDTTAIVKGIYFAKNNGAKIINASRGNYWLEGNNCTSGTGIVMDMSMYNAIKDFRDAGGLFIAAAGNDAENNDNILKRFFPAGFGTDFTCGNLSVEGLDNIISVAAVDNKGNIADFSNYGNTSVHIGAPGKDIYSTSIGEVEEGYVIKGSNYELSTGSQLPNYYSGAINGSGGWYANNYFDNDYFHILPYPDIIDASGSMFYSRNTTRHLTSKSYNVPAGGDIYMSFRVDCYNDVSYPNNGDDFISLSVSGDGQNYTEIFRDDKDGYTSTGVVDMKIPSEYVTSNFSFRWSYAVGNDSSARLCGIAPTFFEIYYKKLTPGQYSSADGTSFSAPYVAGLASLTWSYRQDLNYKEVKDAILKGGDDIQSLSGKTITGKMINANNTLLSLLSPTEFTGSLSFASGAYTNSTGTTISFTANRPGTYALTGNIIQRPDGNYLTGATLGIELTSGDGIKNIDVILEDNFENNIYLTGSIILDTTAPIINLPSVSSVMFAVSGSLTLTGNISDINLKTTTINGTGIILESNGNFQTTLPLTPGLNTITLEATDLAGNTTTETLEVIRIAKAPTLTAKMSLGNVEITEEKEFTSTGIILYGTGELNNVFTGSYSEIEKFSFPAESQTTYYFKGYSIYDGYQGEMSDTGTFTTPLFIDSTLDETLTITGSVLVIDATSSGVIFTNTGGVLNLNGNDGSSLILKSDDLEIISSNDSWDEILSGPEKITSSGNIAVNDYTRINNATYQIGSNIDILSLSGGTAEIKLVVGSTYNGKTLKVYKSNDNQNTFEYTIDCVVTNGICSFETTTLSIFTIFDKNTESSSSSSSSSSGGSSSGGGGGGGSSSSSSSSGGGGGSSSSSSSSSGGGGGGSSSSSSSSSGGGGGGGGGYYYGTSGSGNVSTIKFSFDNVPTESKATLLKNAILSAYALQKIKNGKEIKSKLDILVRNLSDKTLNIINNNLSKANFNKKEFAKYKDIFDYLKHFARYEVFLRANK